MNYKRIFLLMTFCVFVIGYLYSSSQGTIFTEIQDLSYINGEYTVLIFDIIHLIIISIILGVLLTGWIALTFALIDSDEWYIGLIGVIISGVVGCVVLLALRWVYHKFGLKFLS